MISPVTAVFVVCNYRYLLASVEKGHILTHQVTTLENTILPSKAKPLFCVVHNCVAVQLVAKPVPLVSCRV